ncbi:MAG: DinB family protein [Actinomycetes bacterium]
MDMKDLTELIAKYELGTQVVIDAIGDYEGLDIDAKHPEGWSPRQIMHHLADSETNSYIRLRRLIGEENGTLLSGYDEGAWATNSTLGYEVLPIDRSYTLFMSVRMASAEILPRITEADLKKTGVHSEIGQYTLANWFNSYVAHPYDHADQITRAYRREL